MNVKAARRLYLFSMSEKRDSSKSGKKEARKRSSTKTPQQKREDKLRKKLKQSEGEIVSLKDRLLRAAAELDNYRKRTEREFARIVQNANGELIKDILPVIDDLERFLKSSRKAKEFHEGVELIYQKLLAILGNRGLVPMESVGKAFDVEQHDALLQMEKNGELSSIVIEEHEKGYLLRDKVLRHAKVVVSK